MRAFIVTTFLALPLAAWANLAPLAQPTDSDLATLGIHDIRRAILSDEPAARWEHAFLSGNGDTGAMAMGRPLDETIILNHAGLFLPFTRRARRPIKNASLAPPDRGRRNGLRPGPDGRRRREPPPRRPSIRERGVEQRVRVVRRHHRFGKPERARRIHAPEMKPKGIEPFSPIRRIPHFYTAACASPGARARRLRPRSHRARQLSIASSGQI